MPSTLTHYVFNKDLVKDNNYEKIFLLGGQGADVFFFYGYNIFIRKNKSEVKKFGHDIHSINPDNLYMSMLKYAFSKEKQEREILINFVRGFMYHYALDRNVHPYIFYKTGFPYTNPIYNKNHGMYESVLDTLLMEKHKYTNSTRSVLKANKKEIKICSKMFEYIAKELFDNSTISSLTYYKAYKDFRFVRLIADSRFGIKKGIYNTFFKNSSINKISQPRKVKDNNIYDYLNENKNKWIYPSTGAELTYSVNELFNKAREDTRIIDTIIYNFKDNIVTQRKISKFTNNINHDGKNLNDNMTYFKLYNL